MGRSDGSWRCLENLADAIDAVLLVEGVLDLLEAGDFVVGAHGADVPAVGLIIAKAIVDLGTRGFKLGRVSDQKYQVI